MTASNTATNDVTNLVTYRVFNTHIIIFYSYAHFESKFDENLAPLAIFNTI